MTYYVTKVIITTLLIIAISEIAKRSSLTGAILASIPLISVLALVWLYVDTKDVTKVSDLARSIFWLVLPSLALFISLPLLLQQGVGFYISLTISIFITVICYLIMIYALSQLGVRL